jgi:hypothetical protein
VQTALALALLLLLAGGAVAAAVLPALATELAPPAIATGAPTVPVTRTTVPLLLDRLIDLKRSGADRTGADRTGADRSGADRRGEDRRGVRWSARSAGHKEDGRHRRRGRRTEQTAVWSPSQGQAAQPR